MQWVSFLLLSPHHKAADSDNFDQLTMTESAALSVNICSAS